MSRLNSRERTTVRQSGGDELRLGSSDDAVNIGIIDAGTGIRHLGRHIMEDPILRAKPIVIAFTHFHWDHIQGLPFFAPAYVKGRKISFLALGRDRPIDDLERVFSVPMQREYFPVQLSDMGANFEFIMPDVDVRFFRTPSWSLEKHRHPGSAYSYRLSRSGKSIVFTDVEHGSDLDPDIVDFCRGLTFFSMTPNTHQTNLPVTAAGAIQATCRPSNVRDALESRGWF
jgi:phosphoribosyl 1,2-cyclic phosphodiesterase